MQETQVRFPGWEDSLEKEMATHFSILAWRIPWTEEPGRFPVHGVTRIGHNLATKPLPLHIRIKNINNVQPFLHAAYQLCQLLKLRLRSGKHFKNHLIKLLLSQIKKLVLRQSDSRLYLQQLEVEPKFSYSTTGDHSTAFLIKLIQNQFP